MSLQTGRAQQSVTFDVLTQLQDAVALTSSQAGEVATVARVLDFGNVTSGPSAEQVAYTRAKLVADVTAIDGTTGDESYQIVLQLSDDASGNGVGFDAGDTVVNKAVIPIGDAGGVASSTADDDYAVGRRYITVDNESAGVVFRFARAFLVIAGTTPSITANVFLTQPD